MSQLKDIFEAAACNIDVQFVDGDIDEVEKKIKALQDNVNLDAFPCVVLFSGWEVDNQTFLNVVDSVTFLVLTDTNPNVLTDEAEDEFNELRQIVDNMILQFAKNNTVAGSSKEKFPHSKTEKKIIIGGSTYCLAIEVIIEDFTIKKC